MKVLFAVNNESISETIVKKYQKDYKEIVSYKNVYYFNAILKELQNDKTYDRVIISEDLEPFANNNYDTIDKFLFEKLEKIREEATKANGNDIEIILICADRRKQSDDMLRKLFGIKIYNAVIGDERNIDTLCRLMNQPRTKNEAKIAYKVDGNKGMYQSDDGNGVSELEVQNILAHYKRLGKNEDKYVDSFNNIVSQYTDAQLKIIIRYLPLHVKAVLEEKSPKYREISTTTVLKRNTPETYTSKSSKNTKQQGKVETKMLKDNVNKITKPIVIPTEMNNNNTVKINQREIEKEELINDLFEEVEEAPKKGRGRPRKNPIQEVQEDKPKRGRGRPKKEVVEEKENIEEDFDIDLFNIDIDESRNEDVVEDTTVDMDFDLFSMSEEENEENDLEDLDLFNMDMNKEESNEEDNDNIDLFSMDEKEYEFEEENKENYNYTQQEDNLSNDYELKDDIFNDYEEKIFMEPTLKNSTTLNSLLTSEKKIVSFVGTTKNGTSFVVNNLALTLAEMNISTAILDMTQNKNSYYIFTNNEERLRRIAENSISNLENGIAEGIKVSKNLTVYTELPGEGRVHDDIEAILVSLMEKHDVVLIDTDFNTNLQVFEKSQEIYLVQSMDVLTIQPLTAFLRNLRTKNILRQEKIKIIINKEQKLRTLTDSLLIGGMSSYNDPGMTLMTELFNKETVRYCKIPFEVQNYAKYLDSLASCEIYLRGYTKQLLIALNGLAEMVYPLLNKNKYETKSNRKKRMEFSDATRNTLNKMKKNY